MVIPDMVGHQCILFPYILSTGDVQQISVHGLVVTCGYTTMLVAARLQSYVVLLYVHVALLQIV